MINIENLLIQIWYTRFNNKVHDKITIYIFHYYQNILATENFENNFVEFLELS